MVKFLPHPEIAPCKSKFDPAIHKTWYRNDYERVFRDIAARPPEEQDKFARSMMRQLIKDDLFFIITFVMEVPQDKANNPYVVQSCHAIEGATDDGGLSLSDELDIEAREHFKSTTRTIALTIKRIMNNPECCTGIFSYKVDAASDFLVSVRETLEKPLMVGCFPDILYSNPYVESVSWTKTSIRVKRQSSSRGENTVEAFGLVEGMPTRKHFDHRIYDDIETFDIAKSPTQMDLCFSAYEMSFSLGREGGTELIQGTYYNHAGPLSRIRDKKKADGSPAYKLILKPATDNGQKDGNPVLFSPAYWESVKVKAGRHLESQYLCNPTPQGDILLDSKLLQPIEPEFLPRNRFKFQIVDQAGDKELNVTKGDLWTSVVVSIVPANVEGSDARILSEDDLGIADVYIEDLVADQMTHSEAIDVITRMYLRGGMIYQLGVEKVALSTTEIHIAESLKAKGRKLSVDHGNLVLLRPGGRSTEERVTAALQWPLCNGHLFYSTGIVPKYRDKMIGEMDSFPAFHADILNAVAYAYDLFKAFRFTQYVRPQVKSVSSMMENRVIRGDF